MVKKHKTKLSQDEIQKKTYDKPPILGKRTYIMPSYVLNRMIELGIKDAEPNARDAYIRSQNILSQLLKLTPK